MRFYCHSALRSAANAAPEWQARGLGWRSRALVEACPLKGLVRSVASAHITSEIVRINCSIHSNHVLTSGCALSIQLSCPRIAGSGVLGAHAQRISTTWWTLVCSSTRLFRLTKGVRPAGVWCATQQPKTSRLMHTHPNARLKPIGR